jgi:hypothetical protein
MNVAVKPMVSQSSPLSPTITTDRTALATDNSVITSNIAITTSTIKEEDEDEEPFLDASEELPPEQPPRPLFDIKNSPTSSSDYMKSSRSSSSSTSSSIKTNENTTTTVFGRRSILVKQRRKYREYSSVFIPRYYYRLIKI